MTDNRTHFDVAVIGSGIAGSILGTILARHGLQVVIFEAKTHPRFAIGESMILETSEVLRAMSELYDVPELAYFSSEHYFNKIGTSHGVKRHFSYLHHTPGRDHALDRTLQAVIPRQPHGHELHLYRQDSDALLMATAIAYGATVLQQTPVREIDFAPDGVTIHADGGPYTVDYIVDGGGFRSPLAEQFSLRHFDLQTHSRALFTHMIGVPDFHTVDASQKEYGLPYSVAEGTLHHVFDGGWLWIIPFNNHDRATNPLCSVGLMLDPRRHPLASDHTPEEEFQAFMARFPSMARQLAPARTVRPWTRTGRIQYGATQVVGDRFCLLGHAAGFVDPLFSKGLYASLTCVNVLAGLLLDARETRDFSARAFSRLETTTQALNRSNDRLIANAYKSFGDYRLWSVYAVLWLLGAYTELIMLSSIRVRATDRHDYMRLSACLKLVGGGFPEFDVAAERIDGLMEAVDVTDDAQVVQTAAAIKAQLLALDWMPTPFADILHGKNHLPANKIRPSLFSTAHGFLGQGAYRQHFFGDRGMHEVVWAFLQDKARYSTYNVTRRPGHLPLVGV